MLEDEGNLSKFTIQKLLKFNVLVQMLDIQRTQYICLPNIVDDQDPEREQEDGGGVGKREGSLHGVKHLLQFMLYKIGNVKIQRKYKDRLKQLKTNNKAIASISFQLLPTDQPIPATTGSTRSPEYTQLSQTINSLIIQQAPQQQDQPRKRLTNIPFFDIIHDKLQQKQKQKDAPKQVHIVAHDSSLGCFTDQSNIFGGGGQHVQNLVRKFPILYRLYNWQRVFSARKDGSAFNTFLSKAKDVEPAILLVKEYKGNIMGAFLIQSIEVGKTGRGEMFIFTFRGDSTNPEVYTWTTKNDFFVYLDKDQGLGIGMGLKYGLFVNRNLDKGSSAPTKTFGNSQPLSVNEDFHIDDIEIWGVDNSF